MSSLAAQSPAHLRPSGVSFVRPGGAIFQWRGITAFRLLEMVAHGHKTEAATFLDWAAARKLTIVRVFAMAHTLFRLEPADGERALPELLRMAAARGLHVEVVALVDTAVVAADVDAHVKAVGAIAAQHANALVEIANEPAHPTQAARIHDPRELQRLASLIPARVPVSLGSAEENDGFAAGRYATFHFPRSGGQTLSGHVIALARGATLVRTWGKPVISDEPIGAAAVAIVGRRDNAPDRFRAAALLSRLAGLGATFHYEGGLQATIPQGVEATCFDAWNEAWSLLPSDIEMKGVFREPGQPGAAVLSYDRNAAAGVFERQAGSRAFVLAVDARGDPTLRWEAGWHVQQTRRIGSLRLVTAARARAKGPPR